MIGDEGQEFDVVIAGAGPAGLLLGSKLPHNIKVLIIDRGEIGKTSKYWLTNQQRLDVHDLGNCAHFRSDSGIVGSFLGSEAVATGDYAVVDDRRLLLTLQDRCQHHGAVLAPHTSLRALQWGNDRLLLQTSRGAVTARLLIDAMGGSSPLAATFRQHRLDGFFTVYGAHLANVQLHTNQIIGSYVARLGFPAPMLEVFPTGSDSAFAAVFIASRRLEPVEKMRALFQDHLSSNPFFTMREKSIETEPKMGGIPIGRAKRKRVPGVLPFGEAAMIQAPLLGAAFNEVLVHVDSVAAAVGDSFKRTSEGVIHVDPAWPRQKRLNDFLQGFLARRLVIGTLEEYERIVLLLKKLGPSTSYRLFCSELELKDALRVANAVIASRYDRVIATGAYS